VQNTVDNKQIADYAAGVQVENFADTSVALANNTTLVKLMTPIEVDFTGVDPKNDYSLIGSGVPSGGFYNGSEVALAAFANVYFANSTGGSSTVEYNGTGVQVITGGAAVPTLVDSTTVNIDPAYLSTVDPFFKADYLPVKGNVWVEGYSTLDDAVFDREFISPKAQFLKVTKNERLVP
jgi:hypothetical protein